MKVRQISLVRAGWMALALLYALLLVACASLPDALPREHSAAFNSSAETTLGRLFEAETHTPHGWSGVEVLDTGREALQLRLALLAEAERAVDLQYYIWNDDTSGRLLASRLIDVADRGVRVRLLLDDFNINGQDELLMALDAHPNIQVRLYNPNAGRSGMAKWVSLLWDFGRLNQRMHNKSFVVDASAAIVGGRNIGDEYFDMGEEINFRDREVFAVGPVVSQISNGFDSYWNGQRSFPISGIARDGSAGALDPALPKALAVEAVGDTLNDPGLPMLREWRSRLIWADARVLIDHAPELADTDSEKRKALAQQLTETVRQTRHDVLIESAYLVLGEPGLELLGELTGRGVRVRALTNSLASNDLTTNHAAYARRRRQMLENGIELYELRPDAASCRTLIGAASRCGDEGLYGLHAKSIVFDRTKVFVGSFNLNLRSVYLNSEIGLLIDSPELAERIAADIERNMDWENSWRVTLDRDGRLQWLGREEGVEVHYTSEPATGFWRRFESGFLSMLPIEKYM